MVGRKLGIDTGRMKKVDGDFCLHKKIESETGREFAVTARQDSSDVIFECANRTLRPICMVIVGIIELILEILGGGGCTHVVGDLVVEFVKHRIDTSGLQFGVASIIALGEMFCLSILDGIDKDGIGVMIIQQKNAVHATRGGEVKTTWLIH